ncbi:MAG: D-alanine--D-alanine ligase [bacterium]
MKKIRVGVLFGGKSAEHEVSLRSAKNIIAALDPEKYDVALIGIDKAGKWHVRDSATNLLNTPDPKMLAFRDGDSVALIPSAPAGSLVTMQGTEPALDVVFPVLHGTNGEDGTMQGLLRLLDLPFVGPDVLGSAIGMDKDAAKRLLRDAGIPIARFVTVPAHKRSEISFEKLSAELGMPMFVKPANSGSSVGVYKIKTAEDFAAAADNAFKYDTKIIFEECVVGREIECSVLGNEIKEASVPGEIIPHHEFYSYEAKYLDENGAGLEIPAKLTPELVKKMQELAVRTCEVLCVEGMARVDCFLRGDEFIVNEINTIPGFTNTSMYPKLWEASGLSYKDLISKLLDLAIARHERDSKIKRSY